LGSNPYIAAATALPPPNQIGEWTEIEIEKGRQFCIDGCT
jgi:hypothetical protein